MRKHTMLALSLAAAMALTACGGSQTKTGTETEKAAKTEQPAKTELPENTAAEPAAGENTLPAAAEGSSSSGWQPAEPITLICPFNAGSVGDNFSRPFARIMEKYAGVRVLVENMGGGSGSVGTNYMLSRPADGYTFSYHSATGALNTAAGTSPIAEDAVQPLAVIAADYHVLVVKKDSPFETFQDLLDYAHSNPGKLKFGGAQVMGINHLFALLMFRDFEIQADYIPYDDGANSALGLMGGNVDCLLSTASTVASYTESGDFRVLAYTNPEPVGEMGDAPTFKELGSKGLENYVSFKALYMNPNCSDEIKAWYDDICSKVCSDPEWLEFLELQKNQGSYMGMEAFTAYYHEYISDAKELFKDVS